MNFKNVTVLLLIFTGFTFSQLLNGWKNYTSMNKVSAAIETKSGIWAATEGGAFFFNFSDSSYSTLTKTEGLNGSPISAMAIDSTGNIWFGCQNGIIDVYNPSAKSFKSILDIYNSGRTAKQINAITIYGDSAFVSTSFGLSLVDTKSYGFYDTYSKFGNFNSNIKVIYSLKKENVLYVATEAGMAVQVPGTTNLVSPDAWNTFTTSNGLPTITLNKLVQYKGNVYVSTAKGIAVYSSNAWNSVLTDFNSNSITDITSTNDSLYILSGGKLFAASASSYKDISPEYDINSVMIGSVTANEILIATSNGISLFNRNGMKKTIAPVGPTLNVFLDLAVDQNGTLWVATGKDVSGVGFYRFAANSWKVFNTSNTPLSSNAFFTVSTGNDNSVYFGNWGSGFLRLKNDSLLTVYTAQNTPLVGITKNPLFLVVSKIATDSKGNMWVLNFDPADKNVLNVLTKDSTWYQFNNTADPSGVEYSDLVIDQNDTKWFISQNPGKTGLYYFNENGTLQTTSDDRIGYVNGLNSSAVSTAKVDKRGDIWVGTDKGVNVISNPGVILNSSSSALKISSVFSLRQQAINCLAVDAINRKWVGTNQGLIVSSSDGSSLSATFDSKNSPLLSDQIRAITIDEKNGIVYVAVDGGLTAFYTTALAPNTSFTSIATYPSPFKIGKTSALLTIDGLIKDSEIKILTISGNLIRRFSSPGGKIAYWDGKNDDGKLVNSGVYLIIAFDSEGNSVATGKVAVVRE